MKIALCTTTIHVPHALKLMRKCGPDVGIFVATDTKTPTEAYRVIEEVGGVVCNANDFKCSEAIGWNTLSRRNVAFLEALRRGADIIYSWDNDNLAVSTDHFDQIETIFSRLHDGIKVTGTDEWFDPGTLLIPATRHRGFPHNKPVSKHAFPVIGAEVGVVAGLIIGDSDMDASTRIEKAPDISQVHIFGSTGVVVDPKVWTVWNSQNSAVARELMPAWFMAPGCQRHDDIFAALVVQRVMRERGYHVHFGKPLCYQERNPHDLLADLMAELPGMSNVQKMAELLDSIFLVGKNVVDDTRVIYNALAHADWYPKQGVVAAMSWLDDCQELRL